MCIFSDRTHDLHMLQRRFNVPNGFIQQKQRKGTEMGTHWTLKVEVCTERVLTFYYTYSDLKQIRVESL